MTDSTVSDNTAGFAAGGLATGGPGSLGHSTIESNQAQQGAGVLIQEAVGAHFLVDAVTIQGNQVACPGGGLVSFTADSSSSVLLKNSTIDGNSTTNGSCGLGGGGLVNVGLGTLTIANSTIANNTSASALGGGIYNAATLTLLNVTVSGPGQRWSWDGRGLPKQRRRPDDVGEHDRSLEHRRRRRRLRRPRHHHQQRLQHRRRRHLQPEHSW